MTLCFLLFKHTSPFDSPCLHKLLTPTPFSLLRRSPKISASISQIPVISLYRLNKDIPPRPVIFSLVGSILLIFNADFVFLLIVNSFHLMGEEARESPSLFLFILINSKIKKSLRLGRNLTTFMNHKSPRILFSSLSLPGLLLFFNSFYIRQRAIFS